jgi:hypothetical protein
MLKFFVGGTFGDYTRRSKLNASDLASGDFFGYSVALSSDGNTALIGAYFESTSPYTRNGAAYVFTRSGSTWTEQQKLTASDSATDTRLGRAVSLSADGNTAIIGAYTQSTSPFSGNGAAYVFTRSGSTWTQQQKLLASDLASSDYFGQSVALSSDGNTALIGAYFESTSPYTRNGAAYVFTRSGSTWTQQQKLLASDGASSDNFGYSVALSGDGNTALIGAYLEDTSPYTDNGAAYVFTRSGSTWTQQQKLLASDLASGDYFGQSVALSGDGNTALIGAYRVDTSPYTDNGAAYVFTRSGSTWTQQQKLLASDGASNDNFGYSVALSGDGNTALIGAPFDDRTVPYTGAVFVFTRSSSTWTQIQKLIDVDADDLGWAVTISSNGNIVLVGDPRKLEITGGFTGTALIFET